MAFSQYLFFYEWPLLTVGHKSACTKILFSQYPELRTFTLLSPTRILTRIVSRPIRLCDLIYQ